jgi:hypothetical protein
VPKLGVGEAAGNDGVVGFRSLCGPERHFETFWRNLIEMLRTHFSLECLDRLRTSPRLASSYCLVVT